jgi:hypothetical protein
MMMVVVEAHFIFLNVFLVNLMVYVKENAADICFVV